MSKLREAVNRDRVPLLEVKNPGKKELLAMNRLVTQLVDYCDKTNEEAKGVMLHIENQDLTIDKLIKKLKKMKAQLN